MKSIRAPSTDLETIIPILLGVWRRFQKESGPSDKLQTREFRRVVEAVKILEKRHDGKASLVGTDYFDNKELLGAYILYQWVIHYQQGISLIGELPTVPRRVLDLCSGASPFAFAALRWGAKEAIAVDRNVNALELGAEICGRYGMPLTIRRWDASKRRELPVEGKFDLIVLAHALEDLFPPPGGGNHELGFIRYLMTLLTPEGHLMLVDDSHPEQNRRILGLRDALVATGVEVQAPCIWKGECPALKVTNSPCYAQRQMDKPYMIRELQRAAEINLSSLKMSYIIFKAKNADSVKENVVKENEASEPVEESTAKACYRVISPAIEGFKGKRHYLCGTGGKKYLESRVPTLPKEAKAFDYLRRGEVISLENVFEMQNGIDIIEGSSIKVEAACGKYFDAGE